MKRKKRRESTSVRDVIKQLKMKTKISVDAWSPQLDNLGREAFERWSSVLRLGDLPLSGIFDAFISQSRVAFVQGYKAGFAKANEGKMEVVKPKRKSKLKLKVQARGHSYGGSYLKAVD
jgi:hypothetical protein